MMHGFLKRATAATGCAVLIGASAYQHGRFEDKRSSRAQQLAMAAEQVRRLPATCGEWIGVEREIDDPDSLRRAGAERFAIRSYQSRDSSETATVLLLCGKAGPLSTRTANLCQRGAEYSEEGEPRGWKPTEGAEFTWQSFQSEFDARSSLEIAYAWSTNGQWRSPDIPRFEFGNEPFLYKLYVIRHCLRQKQPSEQMGSLLKALLPALKRTVFDAESAEVGQTAPPSKLSSASTTAHGDP